MTRPVVSRRQSWIVLGIAAVAIVFGGGRWHVPAVAWVAPALVLVFLDSRSARRGLLYVAAVQVVAYCIHWWGMIPAPGLWYYLVATIYALAYFLPYVLHRILAHRLDGFIATLILPVAWVSVEFLFQSFVTPYGSWGSVAYTQLSFLPLLQLASITGLAGVSFMVIWGASVGAWMFRRRANSEGYWRGLALYAAVLTLVLVSGQLRILAAEPPHETVAVAAIMPPQSLRHSVQLAIPAAQEDGPGSAAFTELLEAAARLNEDLIERTIREAERGAELIVWSEHAARVVKPDEQSFYERLSELTRDHEIALIAGVGVLVPDGSPPFENKIAAFDARGELNWIYFKARPIVGQESSLIAGGSASVQMLDIAKGRLATAICHDLDFPGFIRTAGLSEAGILVGPAADWAAITPLHARMSLPRAIENGCALVRPCANGLTIFADAYGRVIASLYDDGAEDLTLVADVPVSRVATLYPRLNSLFAYLSLLSLIVLTATALRSRSSRAA